MLNKTDHKQESDERKGVNGNLKRENLFMRFLSWISRGAEKLAKQGGGCRS